MKKNKKSKPRGPVIIFLLLVIAAGYFILPRVLGQTGSSAPIVAYTVLNRADLINSISTKGVVESTNKRNIYSTLGYSVKAIEVEVGDRITAGQVICRLDTEELEMNIASQKADLSVAQMNSLNQLENNQRIYDEATANLQSGTNTQVLNAESSLKTAEINLQNAKKSYENAVSDYESGTSLENAKSALKTAELNLESAEKTFKDAQNDYENKSNASVMNAETSLQNAKQDLDVKKKDFDENTILFNVGAISKDTLTLSETAYNNALKKHDDALKTLENAKTAELRQLEQYENSFISAGLKYNDALLSVTNAETSNERSLEQAENSLKTAQTSYDNAVASLEAVRKSAAQELEKYQNNIISSQISANVDSKLISIQKLEKQLEDSIIKSPIDGTVTAVYAKEGQNATGLMFVVEDTENLLIKTKIKEYDAGKVSEGMAVIIKSDSTGESEFSGTLHKINPAAEKNAQGETNTTGDVEFGADVSVNSSDTPLKIGMNTRLTIIQEKKENVFRVPYDAVYTDVNGSNFIYIIKEDDTGAFVSQLSVETGMEADFYIEVLSVQLENGMRFVNDASLVSDEMRISLQNGTTSQSGGARGFGAFFMD